MFWSFSFCCQCRLDISPRRETDLFWLNIKNLCLMREGLHRVNQVENTRRLNYFQKPERARGSRSWKENIWRPFHRPALGISTSSWKRSERHGELYSRMLHQPGATLQSAAAALCWGFTHATEMDQKMHQNQINCKLRMADEFISATCTPTCCSGPSSSLGGVFYWRFVDVRILTIEVCGRHT